MKHYLPAGTHKRLSQPVIVLPPVRYEGVGQALRAAYRDGTDMLPRDIQELLDQLH